LGITPINTELAALGVLLVVSVVAAVPSRYAVRLVADAWTLPIKCQSVSLAELLVDVAFDPSFVTATTRLLVSQPTR
jgi:hypothetical protein